MMSIMLIPPADSQSTLAPTGSGNPSLSVWRLANPVWAMRLALIVSLLMPIAAVQPALGAASGDRGSDPATRLPPGLSRATRDYEQARIHGDRRTLEQLLADDYRSVSAAAQQQNKAEAIADATALGFSLSPFKIEESAAKLWKDGALLTGAVTLQGTSHAAAFKLRIRFADVWRRSGGKWRLVFSQQTRIP